MKPTDKQQRYAYLAYTTAAEENMFTFTKEGRLDWFGLFTMRNL